MFALKFPVIEAIVERTDPKTLETLFNLRHDLWKKDLPTLKTMLADQGQ